MQRGLYRLTVNPVMTALAVKWRCEILYKILILGYL